MRMPVVFTWNCRKTWTFEFTFAVTMRRDFLLMLGFTQPRCSSYCSICSISVHVVSASMVTSTFEGPHFMFKESLQEELTDASKAVVLPQNESPTTKWLQTIKLWDQRIKSLKRIGLYTFFSHGSSHDHVISFLWTGEFLRFIAVACYCHCASQQRIDEIYDFLAENASWLPIGPLTQNFTRPGHSTNQ